MSDAALTHYTKDKLRGKGASIASVDHHCQIHTKVEKSKLSAKSICDKKCIRNAVLRSTDSVGQVVAQEPY
jgi:hypothetical protein